MRRLAPLALLVLLPLAVSACRDADGGALAVVLTEETRGALELGMELPSLPSAVAGSGDSAGPVPSASGDEWVGRWQASWLMEPPRARRTRRAVYEEAVGPLARMLGPEGVRSRLETVAEATTAASDVDLSDLPPLYRARLDEARTLVERGRAALEDDETSAALRAAFEAADRLRTVSPETVARSLLERARGGIDDLSTRPDEERERINRLLQGAEAAIEDGEYRRAIRRAYYACRLLGVSLGS